MGTIRAMQKEVHQNAVEHGWWGQEQEFGTLIALCHSELSEALEEARKGHEPNDINYECTAHEPYTKEIWDTCDSFCPGCKHVKVTGIRTELADVVIRIMDMCEHYGIDLEAAIIDKHEYNKTRPYKHGGKMF